MPWRDLLPSGSVLPNLLSKSPVPRGAVLEIDLDVPLAESVCELADDVALTTLEVLESGDVVGGFVRIRPPGSELQARIQQGG